MVFGVDGIGGVGLELTRAFVGTDLDGVVGADEKFLDIVVSEVGEVFCDEIGVV